MHRVNYEQTGHLYDKPACDHVVDPNLLSFLIVGPTSPLSRCVSLDIGCGTGKHWWPIVSGSLPCSWSVTFHYTVNQFSYHHIRGTDDLLAEVFRILKPKGRFVVVNIDPWSMTNCLGYFYFPAALELDYRDFLPVEQFVDLMERVGFCNITAHRDRQRYWLDNPHDLLAFVSQRHRASELMAISDETYHAGIRRLQDHIAQGNTGKVKTDFCLVSIRGDKP